MIGLGDVMRKYIMPVVILLCIFLLTACGNRRDAATTEILPEDAIILYYINPDAMELEEAMFHVSGEAAAPEGVSGVLDQLFTRTDWNGQYTLPLPEFMTYNGYEFSEDSLLLYMDITYQDGMKWLEMLCKAAIVKSLCQLEYVRRVTFVFNNLAASDALEPIVENYSAEDFVTSSSDGGYVQNGQIEIYFANEDGSALKEYVKRVEITNNVSLEQVVVESLITGPLREGYTATMPAGTVLNKIAVKDGTAYVNFNESFNGAAGDIRSELTLYSVVDSLCNLPTISRVQILINGERQEVYRETVEINGTLERNLDLIEQEP